MTLALRNNHQFFCKTQISGDDKFRILDLKNLQKEKKRKEEEELEKIKGAFLQNHAVLRGRRWAVTESVLLNQTRSMRNGTTKLLLLRQWSGRKDDWELSEIKRIVLYQMQPKRRLSID